MTLKCCKCGTRKHFREGNLAFKIIAAGWLYSVMGLDKCGSCREVEERTWRK